MSANKEGLLDKGLSKWQEWNKYTLVLEAGMIAAGLGLAVPWLITLGATGAVIDVAQIHLINKAKEWRDNRKPAPLSRRSAGWVSPKPA